MAPRDELDDDIVVDFDKKVLLGYDAQNNCLVAYGSSAPQSLEDYLLKFRTSLWQKWLAKWWKPVCLGFFKKAGDAGHMNWYLFWCNRCHQFKVSYKEGYEQGLYCHCYHF